MPVSRLVRVASFICLFTSFWACPAKSAPPEITQGDASAETSTQDLYLEVYVNGASTEMVAAVRKAPDGQLSMPADQLNGVGLQAGEGAKQSDNYVALDDLKDVTYRVEDATQSIYFDATDDARVARKIGDTSENTEALELTRDFGGLLNYSVFGNFSGDNRFGSPQYQGLSASFDARMFSAFGLLESGFIVTSAPNETYASRRLATSWSYSDPERLMTYAAGDIITGGLSWTRPVRLGGVQIRRSFNLRPDLVTMPMPELTGSAAVPSTVEVYANNLRRFTGEVGTGPFQVTGVPFVSGPGTVQVIVKDQFGRETVKEMPFFVSSRMLAKGLVDFSFEGGFARRDFGLRTDNYDDRFVGSGSLRYGLTQRLTLEAHAEGGAGLLSGGAAALFNVGSFGIVSVNAAASHADGVIGYRVGGSLEASFYDWRFFASTQRTIGDYNDIASITSRIKNLSELTTIQNPRSVDQVTLSPPVFRDGSSLNLNFAHLKDFDGQSSSILGLSYSRPFVGKSTLYANGYMDVAQSGSFGMFVGLSMPLGGGSVSSGVETTDQGTRLLTDYSYPLGPDPWSVGWRLQDSEGYFNERQAGVTVRTPVARVEATGRQYDSGSGGTLEVSGAIASAGGGVFLSDRIYDAFAVVDAGAPDVPVTVHNRSAGKTGRNGKLLVPDLLSLQKNLIEIDPSNLPVDIDIPATRTEVTPAEKGGVVVRFGIKPDKATALVTFVRSDGSAIPVGAEGRLVGVDEPFVVGYDGQSYVRGLTNSNSVEIELPDSVDGSATCRADFPFHAVKGSQVTLENVVCR